MALLSSMRTTSLRRAKAICSSAREVPHHIGKGRVSAPFLSKAWSAARLQYAKP
ncbi:hypothetical protein [Nannocystis pusilla]|uniref:hypothetical protein n=1 Tax=Nannocystis pusilla TaxID=889268 RepID=UPI003DA460E2